MMRELDELPIEVVRNKSHDARFLLQATFGPTRDSLVALGQMSYEDWIQEQLKLPVESHREYYRARVNPPYIEARMHPESEYLSRSLCAAGSRWHSMTFLLSDVGKTVKVKAKKILVDSVFRTDVEEGPLPSRWSRFVSADGYICSVVEAPAGKVVISHSADCKTEKLEMPNPSIWLADHSQVVNTTQTFDQLKPGVLLLINGSTSCDLASATFMKTGGQVYLFDTRLELLQNTLESPAVGAQVCPPKTFLNEHGCQLNSPESSCFLACGSPGEISNDPALGHQLPMYTKDRESPNMDYDNKYYRRLSGSLSKTTVWTMKAMQAKDQLRQRMAWALSQIIVASVPGLGDDHLSETWLNYYDIYVRHALGNFRDVLREVTYSPVMGSYLTYKGSSSYDHNERYPDENYAREIMQLFTIGVAKLNQNGTLQLDTDGKEIPTYSNEHIMNFARVFTGFQESPFRTNIEVRNGNDNRVDPMWMDAKRHDRYPKPDLDGNYLGDGYPLCSDVPSGAFLAKGARYEFLGRTFAGEEEPLVLEDNSLLYAALCSLSSGFCAFKPVTVLDDAIKCTGKECNMDTVEVVKVGDNFFEYVLPTCVHMFFYNGQEVVKGDNTFGWNRKCANPDTAVAGASCCSGCSDIPTGGMVKNYQTCSNYTSLHKQCTQNSWWVDQEWCQISCWKISMGYARAMEFANNCSRGDYKEARLCGRSLEGMRLHAAEALCRAQGMDLCPTKTEVEATCNYHEMFAWMPNTCSVQVQVHDDNKISAHTDDKLHDSFAAQWLGPPASPGFYTATVEVRAVFIDIPSKEELLSKLKIAAFPTEFPCVPGNADVNVCVAETLEETTAYQEAVLASGPVAYWHLDEKSGSTAAAVDSSGNAVAALAGQYVQSPALGQAGLVPSGSGSAVAFDGSSQHAVHVPNHALINLGTFEQKTVELWFAASSLSAERHILWMQGGNSRGLSIYVEGRQLVMNAWNLPESNWGPVSVSTPIDSGKKYHVALVLDGNPDSNASSNDGKLHGFLNGALFGSASDAGVLRSHSGNVCIGCSRSGGLFADGSKATKNSAYFSGTIDEVSIANSVLNPQTLLAHYEASIISFSSNKLSADTVFELNGKYYKNVESVVSLNGTFTLRNPPVFMFSGAFTPYGMKANRAALAEVETLLDHLLYNNNTAPSISKKLIQRFVTSNPSCSYVGAVAEAFRTGTHAGVEYSGKYGDLAATCAAILLHEDARTEMPNLTKQGVLREPLLKIIHFLRAMEYEEQGLDHIVFNKLQDVIGQFPFQSPTVFNYFMPDFEPPRFSELPPDPEPEPEPEPVAPEFQIFTPPYFAGWLNGMAALIHDGISQSCSGRNGLGIYIEGSDTCPRGQLTFQASAEKTLEELDILLTGGRLTPKTKELLRSSMDAATEGEQLATAQQVLTLTPEFHTLGAPLPQEGERQLNVSKASTAQQPYRATVMLFLFGGADTFNMLVPQGCALYDEYRQVRDDVALQPSELNSVNTPGKVCSQFGIHAALTNIKKMYDAGHAAFVSNIGALVQPLTPSQFKDGNAPTCLGLFSHSHQQAAAQTLKCQIHGASPRGAGGRLADMLSASSNHFKTMSFSLAGTSIWSQGFDTHTEIVDKSQGAVRFGEYERWRKVIGNITSQLHGNVYLKEYTQAFLDTIQSSEHIGSALDGVTLETNYVTDSGLQKQLHQVARLIKTRQQRGAERDFFFVELGGWDTHSNVKDTLRVKFAEMDAAINGFVKELESQRVFDSVVLMTESDFGRTLSSNGGGTDHGWAGNHLVIGGKIHGGQIFNEYPSSLLEGSSQDAGRGRLIPKYPWESVMAPIAEWMGLESGQQSHVFPNIGNFNASHIISKASLFRA
jgi:uncharacterized protein (DUF1800 family)/uncharacterized protein (DUF1501 family)